jgi:acetyl esterase/lipase
MHRRHFLPFLVTCASCANLSGLLTAADEPVAKKTCVFKTVGECPIKADVYGSSAGAPRPAVIWIHGGALIMGDRNGIDRKLRDRLLKAGYAIVSIDYRLAPETKLPAILEDVQDAYRWVREKGPGLFNISTKKIAVMGGSAGGYLTLATGYRVEPRPTVLVSFWGYGDIAGTWYSRPDPHYCRAPLVPKEEAYRSVGPKVISETPGKNNRFRFYLYCRQQGLWANEVAGLDPEKDAAPLASFCPIRNVTANYAPTLLIHGTQDTDVPHAQSETMAKELARAGVEQEFISVPEGGHGLGGVEPAVISNIHDRVLSFLDKHMR